MQKGLWDIFQGCVFVMDGCVAVCHAGYGGMCYLCLSKACVCAVPAWTVGTGAHTAHLYLWLLQQGYFKTHTWFCVHINSLNNNICTNFNHKPANKILICTFSCAKTPDSIGGHLLAWFIQQIPPTQCIYPLGITKDLIKSLVQPQWDSSPQYLLV